MCCPPGQLTSRTNALLSQITSSSVETIPLSLQVCSMEEMETIDGRMFAESFSRPQFAQLRTVELIVDRCHGQSEIKAEIVDKIKAKWSECVARINICTFFT